MRGVSSRIKILNLIVRDFSFFGHAYFGFLSFRENTQECRLEIYATGTVRVFVCVCVSFWIEK